MVRRASILADNDEGDPIAVAESDSVTKSAAVEIIVCRDGLRESGGRYKPVAIFQLDIVLDSVPLSIYLQIPDTLSACDRPNSRLVSFRLMQAIIVSPKHETLKI